ncbi:unnamed protein product [Kuraishia capsulata CBS 1993]|uniref:MHD2 domain-containing protein n=1 Tax=Kuraishia capsulata CBS 1993 TaxID=1382522 RepID=W6MLH1_9ASCO|nr:uncharacterized protein KUCA_T00001632001 [Kuraishia capsulata CBS 1993]CDK25662.1 unnamed protein product [Kuraishia capsulata CBS 1993]
MEGKNPETDVAIDVLRVLIVLYRMSHSVEPSDPSLPPLTRESTASSNSSGHQKKYSLKIRRGETFGDFYARLINCLKMVARNEITTTIPKPTKECFLAFLSAYSTMPQILDSPQTLVGLFSQVAAKRNLEVASTTREFINFILSECRPDLELSSTFAKIRDSLIVPQDTVEPAKLPLVGTFLAVFGKDSDWLDAKVAKHKSESVGAVYYEVFDTAILPFSADSFPNEKAYRKWLSKDQQERLKIKEGLPRKGIRGNGKQAFPTKPYATLAELCKRCVNYCIENSKPLDEEIRKLINECSILWLIDPFSESLQFLTSAYHVGVERIEEVALLQVFTVSEQLAFERKYYNDLENWPSAHQNSWRKLLNAFYVLSLEKLQSMTKTLHERHKLFDPLVIFVQSNILRDPLFTDRSNDLPERLRHCITLSAKQSYESIPKEYTGFLRLDSYLRKVTETFSIARRTCRHEIQPGFNISKFFAEESYKIASSLAQDCLGSKESPHDIRELNSIVMNYSALKLFAGFKDYSADEKVFFAFAASLIKDLNEGLLKHITKFGDNDTFTRQSDEIRFSSIVIDIFDLCKAHRDLALWRGDDALLKAKVSAMAYEGIAEAIILYSNKLLNKIQQNLQSSAQTVRLMSKVVFEQESCVALNNLNTVLKELNAIEEGADLDLLSDILERHEKTARKRVRGNRMNLTVSILQADLVVPVTESSNVFAAVSVADKKLKTRSVPLCASPRWAEELEFEITNPREPFYVEVRGGKKLYMDSKYIPDLLRIKQRGVPVKSTVQDRNSKAKLHIEVFLEDRKENPVFFMGRARRILLRDREIALSLFALKLCAPALDLMLSRQLDDESTFSVFEYLDQNLMVLSNTLTSDSFEDVKDKSWNSLYGASLALLLPSFDEIRDDPDTTAVDNLIDRFMVFGGFGPRKAILDPNLLISWMAQLKGIIYGVSDSSSEDMKVFDEILGWYELPIEELRHLYISKQKSLSGKPVSVVSRNLSRRASMRMGSRSIRQRDADALKQLKQTETIKVREACDRILKVLLAKDDKAFVRQELDTLNSRQSNVMSE